MSFVEKPCDKCYQRGFVSCPNFSCFQGKVSCSSCSETGWKMNYDGSRASCSQCFQSGKTDCRTCNGSYLGLKCPKCKGMMSVREYKSD